MTAKNYIIAIPSHRRAKAISEKTLKLLSDFPKSDIYIFISDEQDEKEYAYLSGYNIIKTNSKSATEKFNYVHSYFAGNTFVVVVEDDIESIVSIKKINIKAALDFMCAYCYKNKISCFGVYPSSNAFFMKKSISIGLAYLVANLYGFIPTEKIVCTMPSKTDYERSVLMYNAYGKVARFNFLACKTKNYQNKGGMQESENRAKDEHAACLMLAKKYPTIFSINSSRKSKYTELSMKQSTINIAI